MYDQLNDTYSTVTRKIPVWGWYLFWLCVVLYLYWPSIIILPKRDHAIFMMGRHLVENDWKWFMDVLSYNRTRLLQPGDYFAFRPVHMAILALGDIIARYNFTFQGVLSCSIMATTATIFFALARKITGRGGAAFALTLLWVSQLAGVEIVLWQHITPYLLAPAFMFISVMQLADENWEKKQIAVCFTTAILACLTHELCVIISSALVCLLLFDKRLRRKAVTTLLPAVALALAWNTLDYKIIHPPPSILGPGDYVSQTLTPGSILNEIIPLAGSIGSAFIRPDSIKITLTDEFSFLWIFNEISYETLRGNAIIIGIMITTSAGLLFWQIVKRGINAINLYGLFFLLFFGAIFSVTSFRALTRGIGYLFGAGYYFSLFSLVLCGLLAYTLSLAKARVLRIASIVVLALAIWHGKVLRETLASTTDAKKSYATEISSIRNHLQENKNICFAGMDALTVMPHFRTWMALFQEFSCAMRPGSQPLYLADTPSGFSLQERKFVLQPVDKDLLPALQYSQPLQRTMAQEITSPVLPFGYPVDISYKSESPLLIEIVTQNDISYSFSPHYNELLIMANHDFDNTIAWNTANAENYIQIQFTAADMLVFINNILIATQPRTMTTNGTYCYIKLKPQHPGVPLHLSKFSIASSPLEAVLLQ